MAKMNERHQISYYLVFFIIHATQFGIGVLGFQKIVVKEAGHDAWIAVILAGLYIHILIWMMYRILRNANGSLMAVHKKVYGKWIGNAVNLLWISYFFCFAIVVLRTYIEVIEVWMFPDISVWLYSGLFILLIYYIVMGGIRVVTGIAFFGTVLPLYLILTFIIFPLEFADYNNLMPILSHNPKEIFSGVKEMALTILGFEVLYILYPFIKQPEKSQKWAHFGNLFTTILYFVIMVISILYFSEQELLRNSWATLAMWKVVEMPFVERFEYIGIANWSLIILPNICIAIWCANRGLKELFETRYKNGIIVILVLMFIAVNLLEGRSSINQLNELFSQTGYYLMVYYTPVLFVMTWIRERWQKRSQQNG